jgi:hypothetical protein
MPRGFWDWGVNPSGVVLPAQISLDELAARLGSPDVYDRLGDVLLIDSFEHGDNPWLLTLGAAGSAGGLTAASSRSGGYAYQLDTASTLNDSVTISRLVAPHTLRRFGIEASFTVPSALDDGAPQASVLFVQLQVFDGATVHRGSARLTLTAGQMAVESTGAAYQDTGAALAIYSRSMAYHTLKFVIDVQTDLYARLRLDSTSFAVSTVALATAVSATRPLIQAILTLQTSAAAVASNRWDDVILTQNEP